MLRVSVTIPAFNEGKRLPPYLSELAFAAQDVDDVSIEFLVSDDGSANEHLLLERRAVAGAEASVAGHPARHTFRLVAAEKNRGKGAAVRRGWEEADPSAEWLGFLDADGSIGPRELIRVLRLLPSQDVEVVCGSRIKMAGRRIGRKLFRHLQGRVFATVAELSLGLGLYDPQCGLKLFRAAPLRRVLPALREDRWVLDLEVLAALHRDGARIVEVPIDWVDTQDSRVRFGVDPLRMLWGVRRIKGRHGG